MPKVNLFFDSSALISGIVSEKGAARALLLLAEDTRITITVSEQVIAEVERNIARKIPTALAYARELLRQTNLVIVHDPDRTALKKHAGWISHPADLPILIAAVQAKTDFLVTLNTKHFIDDPLVSQRSGLRIGTPGDALSWVRDHL